MQINFINLFADLSWAVVVSEFAINYRGCFVPLEGVEIFVGLIFLSKRGIITCMLDYIAHLILGVQPLHDFKKK